MIKSIALKFWPHILLLLVIIAFFYKLFLPLSIFVTPDFARSDVLHALYPAKYILWQNLHNAQLPLWESSVGQGYPLSADGIMGTFYLPNLIIFGIFPFNLAIPLMYLSTFLIAAFGMYTLLIRLKLDPIPSVIGSLAFAFCASIVLHVQHFNFIQAASLLPIILYLLLGYLDRPNVKNSLLLTILFSQLFFTGFVQLFTYAVIIFFIFLILQMYLVNRTQLFTKMLLFIIIILTSLIISAVQLLPSIELSQKSARAGGLGASHILKNFPMSPKNLATYINPYILGSAKNGTANSTDWENHGVFWESTSYIGLIPIILVFFSLVFLLRSRRNKVMVIILLLALITLLLSLGKYTPTHFFFSFPPLSFFRVPSRFILFTQFFLAILAAYGATELLTRIPSKLRRTIVLGLVTFLVADIFIVWLNYNPTGTSKEWTKDPEIANVIKNIDANARIYTIGSGEAWNEVFVHSGWENNQEKYLFLRNSLDQNLNILFSINHFNVFETLPTRRYLLQNSILLRHIVLNNGAINIDKVAKSILDNSNVKFLVSTKVVKTEGYEKIFETKKEGLEYYIFQSTNTAGIGKIYFDFKTIDKPDDYIETIASTDLDRTVILEQAPNIKPAESQSRVNVISVEDNKLQFETQTEKPAIFVTSTTYYPGWKAKVDGNETKITGANINSQAIEIPSGKHMVEFIYSPISYRAGLTITLFGYLALITAFLLPQSRSFLNRYQP